MSGNYDRVCRLCLSSRGELLPIFPTTSSDDSEPPVLASKIKDCVSVQINENDDLPTNVCRKCADNVNNWHIFKAVCERTQIKLQSLRDGSQLEEIQVKSEPYSDEAYDDGVVIDGSYPENAATKVQPEGPPILASLGLTPRSDKGADSDKEEEEDEEDLNDTSVFPKIPNIPEVSITVMRPTGETLQSKQGIHQLASKDCLVCGRSYRYSHNARRHELNSHGFDRYTNKVTPKKTHSDRMQPKLRPNPFNPKARLMPNPVNQKMQFMTQNNPHKMMARSKVVTPSRPIPIKTVKSSNVLPYPLRIKALKDLQIKKKEPQILKTLLTSKPEVLVSEPEILNSGPESPETLISEPEIASFQVETILSEPDVYGPAQDDDEEDGEMHNNQSQNYDTVEMDSENEIEIARQQTNEDKAEGQDEGEDEENGEREQERPEGHENDDKDRDNENNDDTTESQHNDMDENINIKAENDTKDGEEEDAGNEERDNEENDNEDNMHEGNEDDDDEELHMSLAPVVEINEDLQNNADFSKDGNEENEEDEELEETVDPNDTVDDEPSKELDPDKTYITKTQRDFILKYRDVIEQINTMRCLCCDREHPRRKAVIQHLQKNGQRVPKHTCYNCVITFGHIGALLSHMRANACTDVWKIIYNENGITDDLVLENEPKEDKSQYKDILSARSYACKMCPAKFNLKQFIMRHVLEVHEDGQSRVPLVCVHCRNRFKDKNLLKKHIRKGDCMVYISCDLCSEKFINLQDFNDHALAVHAGSFDPENQSKCVDGRPTDCPLCGKKNNNYPNLVKHLKIIHNEEKPHYCQHCDAKFEQTPELNKHIYMEHSDRSLGVSEPDMSLIKDEAEEYHYSCTECNAIFETVDAWTDHQVAEHNQVAHHCDQCEKKFLRPSELAEHKNTHLRVKFYPCNGCPNSYSSPVKLAEHMQQVHPGMAPTPNDMEFFCDICVRSFKSRQAYSNHMRIHAKIPTTNRKPTENKGFAPQIIGKPIKQMPVVQQPSFVYKPNTNVPNAPYSCDICGKGFMHKKNIWKHKKVLHADLLNDRNDSEENTMHASTEEEEFNPEENGAILSTPQFNSFNFSSFTNNIPQAQTPPTPTVSTTVTEMPYSCELCYKRFPLRTSLWKHKRAKHGIVSNNTNEMQPQQVSDGSSSRSSCTICKITFSDKKSYYRHRKNVHKSTVQMCKICGKPLNSTLELYEHLKAAHARELLGYNATQGPSKPQPEVSQDLEPEYDNEPEAVDPNDYQARYPCDTCGKQFVGLLALQNHQCINQMQSQPQTFDCEICHKSYSSISALKSHRGWHLRSPDGKAAANNSGLWMPQHKVTSKISKHEILDPSQLARVTHTTTTPPPPVAPPSAAVAKRRLPPEVEVTVVNPNKKLRSDDSIDLDQQNCALDDRYCTICDKEFTKRAAYQRHMDEVHQPNSVFCPVCDKSFTRKSTLLIHMKKHYESGEGSSSLAQTEQEEENHSCDVCGLQFDTEQGMLTHKAMNHGDESEAEESEDDGNVPIAQPGEFTCGQCGDGVATPRDLIAHRSMHATPTKFFCNICKVYFSRALDLSSHTRARHADNEKVFFPCAMCDRFYMNKKSLQRHIEMVH